MSFSALKKRKNTLESLKSKAQSSNSQGSYEDDRIWQLERDKADNGFAIIRFLDVSKADQDHYGEDEEVAPWAHYYTHGFKNDQGRWFFDNCLTSIGQNCPVCESNGELWNSGVDANKEIARNRKRKEHYVANIYVVKDSANPQNEGKVFLYKFGPSIFQMISDAMSPEFEDEVGFNPFDFWSGANFKLKARKSDGYIKYDKSSFDDVGPLFEDDDDIEKVWEKSYALHELIAKDKFKGYDELKSKLTKIIGGRPDTVDVPPVHEPVHEPEVADSTDDDDDSLDYFRSKLED